MSARCPCEVVRAIRARAISAVCAAGALGTETPSDCEVTVIEIGLEFPGAGIADHIIVTATGSLW